MWKKPNALTEKLRIQYPIIQGPFGGGFSTADLVVAVSESGGLGSFGAHNLSPTEILGKIREIKARTERPFAMNLWVSCSDNHTQDLSGPSFRKVSAHYQKYFDVLDIEMPVAANPSTQNFEDQAEALIEGRPAAFSFVFGIPCSRILERCRQRQIVTIGAATTLDEALAVEEAGVDCVLVSGFEAGGHRPSFLRPTEESLMGLSALLAQVASRVRIPIIAAGGIVNLQGMMAAHLLGAQGFQLGTAFLACEESGASRIHKEVIFSPAARYTVLSKHYTGRLARFIENQFTRETRTQLIPHLPYPAQNHFLAELKKFSADRDQKDITPLYAGQGAPLLKHRTVKALMASLVGDKN